VIAVGHPWGLEGAATAGIVIGVGDLPGLPAEGREMVAASLHLRPGDSGGVLVDAEGRLVGINTMMAGPDLGLAISVDEAKRFAREALGTKPQPADSFA
jgi:S1-C subfamily serine protease